jgi:hypothetical protein
VVLCSGTQQQVLGVRYTHTYPCLASMCHCLHAAMALVLRAAQHINLTFSCISSEAVLSAPVPEHPCSAGLPVWWHTTDIHRAQLSQEAIADALQQVQAASLLLPAHLHVYVVSSGESCSTCTVSLVYLHMCMLGDFGMQTQWLHPTSPYAAAERHRNCA